MSSCIYSLCRVLLTRCLFQVLPLALLMQWCIHNQYGILRDQFKIIETIFVPWTWKSKSSNLSWSLEHFVKLSYSQIVIPRATSFTSKELVWFLGVICISEWVLCLLVRTLIEIVIDRSFPRQISNFDWFHLFIQLAVIDPRANNGWLIGYILDLLEDLLLSGLVVTHELGTQRYQRACHFTL